jgi:hypothetical protein
VTLNLFIATPDGLWLSSDFRVSDPLGGEYAPREDHWSAKDFQVHAANHARMAVTYTGVAEVSAIEPDLRDMLDPESADAQPAPGKRRTVPVSEWLSWVLAGESRTVERAVEHIATEAKELREFRFMHHIFTGIVHAPYDGCWVMQLSNLDMRKGEGEIGRPDPRWFKRRPLKEFRVYWHPIKEMSDSLAGGIGSGALSIKERDLAQLNRATRFAPRDPKDYQRMLAEINRRVAGRTASVSPACQTIYINPHKTDTSNGAEFDGELWENGQVVPSDFEVCTFRLNIFGIDLTQLSRTFFSGLSAECDTAVTKEADEGHRESNSQLDQPG